VNRQLALNIELRDDATFSNYVGASADAVLQTFLVSAPWTYIWGPPGSGRSHLLQACCHYKAASIYLSGLRTHEVGVFEGLESMSVICIDDVDEILCDAAWEEALFHLMNAVRDAGTRIILSGERQARALAVKLPDLKSRIVAAVPIEITDLSDDEKLTVLMQRAHNRGFRLGEDVGKFILSRSRRDMTRLLELLKILETETLRQGKTVTIPFVKKTLKL